MDRANFLAPPGELHYEGELAWLTLCQPGQEQNTLSSSLLWWLDEVLAVLEANGARGLVIRSSKPTSFVAGADLGEIATWTEPSGVERVLTRGHDLLGRLEKLPFPTVAAIQGACLGGGLELALACRWRIAAEHPATRLGFPEVRLGLIPGLGGTQRLPRLLGVRPALELLTSGRQLDAAGALQVGLVDEICHPADLELAARARLEPRRGRRSRTSLADLLALVPGGKALLLAMPRRRLLRQTGGHYPAPLAALDAVADGLGRPLSAGLARERQHFARLVVSPAAKRLSEFFFLKNEVEARAEALARGARPISRLAIVGAGFMGAAAAALAAEKGFTVSLKDQDLPGLSRGVAQANTLLAGRSKHLRPTELATRRNRLRPTLDVAALRGAELVVEAVFEDLATKKTVLAEIEAVVRAECVVASNTSTLPISALAAGCRRPDRVLGMHFFSPVGKMPLLEIIRHRGTSPFVLATAVEVGRRLGKTVIVVADGPGFYTTRVLSAMLNEATWCLLEGAKIEDIDRALVAWGWPVGPLTLMDEVGLDVGVHVSRVMAEAFGARAESPPVLAKLVEAGHRGRKSGCGFYRYGSRGKKTPHRELYRQLGWRAAPLPAAEIAERCFLALLNETSRAMADGIIEQPVDVDVGALLGFGFPAFRGGPLREAEQQGLSRLVERLAHYQERHGQRFEPAPLLVEMAASGAAFYRQG